MTGMHFIKVSGESKHRVGKIHKRKSFVWRPLIEARLERTPRWTLVSESCSGQSVKGAFSRRCKCNQHAIQRGANECVRAFIWEVKDGEEWRCRSRNELNSRAQRVRIKAFTDLMRAVGIRNMLILCFATYWIPLNFCLLGGLWRSC